jgi:hypothetical protein
LLDDLLEENYIAGTKTHNEYSDDIIRNFEDKLVKTQKKNKLGIEKFAEEDKNEEPTSSTS